MQSTTNLYSTSREPLANSKSTNNLGGTLQPAGFRTRGDTNATSSANTIKGEVIFQAQDKEEDTKLELNELELNNEMNGDQMMGGHGMLTPHSQFGNSVMDQTNSVMLDNSVSNVEPMENIENSKYGLDFVLMQQNTEPADNLNPIRSDSPDMKTPSGAG